MTVPEGGLTCTPEWGEHAGFTDTGERGVNPLTKSEFEIWDCACGERALEVFPNTAPEFEAWRE